VEPAIQQKDQFNMFTKLIRFVATLIVITSIAGNTGIVRADGIAPSSLRGQNFESPYAPQSLNIPSLTIPAASSLGVQFVHIVTAANIYASYTTIMDNPLTNGNPNAIILVTPNDTPGNVGGINDPHPIGVMYSSGKWAIFNQDLAAMPVGAAFNVIIPTDGAGVFVQNTTSAGTSTNINNALTDGHPNAIILVTPNYNPGGACPCVSANFRIGVEYSGIKWAIFTQDNSLMPLNAAFNVFILPATAGVFVHTATVVNTANVYSAYIDNALINGNPNAIIFVTQNWNPNGVVSGTNDDHPIGVFYNGSKWEIYNQDLVAMPVDASFNVLVLVPSSDIFVHKTTADNGGGVAPYTIMDNALTNSHANALIFATQNLNPGGVSGANDNHNISAYYNGSQWGILNQDGAMMQVGAAFNVLVPNPDASVFVQKATTANILSHSTVIDYPLTNSNPGAIILVTPNYKPGGVGGTYDDHPLGVFYDGSNWRIFNQDSAAMPVDAAFNVFVPKTGANVFVHTATVGNIINPDSTEIDNALTNGHPNAIVVVTPNWNPGGVGGTNDNHPIGVYYDGITWAIFNQDGGTMPLDAAFNVYVFSPPTTFMSVGANDGWILESTETSGLGGTLNSSATTFNLGDDAAKKQYRGILSFSTGATLPDNAVITSVTLKVKRQGVTGGGNPVTLFQGFMVDIKKGFFGTAALQASDFQAKAHKSYGPFVPAPSGGWYSIDLTSGKAYINKLNTLSGLTQIRLRFQLDDNNNTIANYLSLFSGNAPDGSRPQLVIQYYVP
jgi:hypothetical protein